MNYLTYVDRGRYADGDWFAVVVATGPNTKPTPDGGPWATEYEVPRRERHRLREISENAERMLFQSIRSTAPEVYARRVALGWSPLPISTGK